MTLPSPDEYIRMITEDSYKQGIRDGIKETLVKMLQYYEDGISEKPFRNLEDEGSEAYDKILHEDPVSTGISPYTETRKGHWEDCSNGWMCSVCCKSSIHDYKYCPNCGSLMKEVVSYD